MMRLSLVFWTASIARAFFVSIYAGLNTQPFSSASDHADVIRLSTTRFSILRRIWQCGDATRAPGVVSKEIGSVLYGRCLSTISFENSNAKNPGSLRAEPSSY